MMTNYSTAPTEGDAYRAAHRHANRKIGFFIHLAVYLTVNSLLLLANLIWLPRIPFAAGPLLGWGIGLLFHALAVFLHAPGAGWKQRMIDKEIDRIRAASHSRHQQ